MVTVAGSQWTVESVFIEESGALMCEAVGAFMGFKRNGGGGCVCLLPAEGLS